VDYEAIDLTPFVNAHDDVTVPGVEMWRGKSVLRGLPFAFAERDGETRLLHVEPGDSLTVPVESQDGHVRTSDARQRGGELRARGPRKRRVHVRVR
jgi:hypothetical protein